MIEIENLSKYFRAKRFKKVQAVNGVSFTVGDGEVLGLLGPNGAGKTTIMRLLGTVLQPTGGTARVGDFDVRQHPNEVRRVLGVLPEYWGLYERFSPREHLLLFGKFYRMDKCDSRKTHRRADLVIRHGRIRRPSLQALLEGHEPKGGAGARLDPRSQPPAAG